MDLNLEGKVALVTGGARGLGRAICVSLACEGANVAVNCRRPEQRDEPVEEAVAFVEELETEYGAGAVLTAGDVSDSDDVAAIFDRAEGVLGAVDIVVNNAAVWPGALIRDMTEAEWRRTVEVNLTGAFLVCRHAVRSWLDAGRKGRIINIVSAAAFRGSMTGHAHYAAAKAGLVNLTVSLAREVAANGINVNAVAPGMMATDMTEEVFRTERDRFVENIPLNRLADCAEVADVVAFLASERASYITGATLDVTGGMLMR